MGDVYLHRLTVAASGAGIRQLVEEFAGFCADAGLPDSLRRRFQVALDEVVSNVARHARPADGLVEVAFESAADTVTVTVEDGAPAFNPLGVPRPDTTAPLEFRKAGGVGIEVVRGLLDEVRYERVGGRNRLTMVDRPSRAQS